MNFITNINIIESRVNGYIPIYGNSRDKLYKGPAGKHYILPRILILTANSGFVRSAHWTQNILRTDRVATS